MCRVSSQSTRSAARSSSSTRSVTSSRFPIGVAQTASGTGYPQRLERDERGADQPRRVPSSARATRTSSRIGAQRLAPHHLARRPEQLLPRGDAEAAADHDHVRLEQVHERAHAGPRWRPISARIRARSRRPRSRAARAGARPRPARTPRAAGVAAARAVRLDVAAPGARPWHGSPSSTITMCPSSTPPPLEPRNGAPLEMTPPPTPVPSVSRTRSRAAAGADTNSRERRRVPVVVAPDRQAEPLPSIAQRHVVERHVHARRRARARGRSATARRTRPRRCRREQLGDRRLERSDERLLRLERRRALVPAPTSPSRVTKPARIFVPPRSMPITRVPLTVSGYPTRRMAAPETSRTASTGVAAARARCRPCRGRATARRREQPARPATAARRGRRPVSRGSAGRSSRSSSLVVLARRLGGRGLLVVPQRRRRREQALRAGHDGGTHAAERLPPHAPTTILLLGTDPRRTAGRPQQRPALGLDHAPAHRSEPPPARLPLDPARPLVPVPRRRQREDQRGVPGRRAELAIRTVDELTGPADQPRGPRRLQHLQGSDRRGGRDHVNVPETILSNRFDCPYATEARCLQWKGWRFHQGGTHMNGDRR